MTWEVGNLTNPTRPRTKTDIPDPIDFQGCLVRFRVPFSASRPNLTQPELDETSTWTDLCSPLILIGTVRKVWRQPWLWFFRIPNKGAIIQREIYFQITAYYILYLSVPKLWIKVINLVWYEDFCHSKKYISYCTGMYILYHRKNGILCYVFRSSENTTLSQMFQPVLDIFRIPNLFRIPSSTYFLPRTLWSSQGKKEKERNRDEMVNRISVRNQGKRTWAFWQWSFIFLCFQGRICVAVHKYRVAD